MLTRRGVITIQIAVEVRRNIIEVCRKLMGDLPRIELFARQKTEGWDAWGDEVPEEKQTKINFEPQTGGVK